MTPQPPSNLPPGDIVRALFRHSRQAFIVFSLVVLATICWIYFGPREYESFAKVYVRVGHEATTLDPSATTGQTINIAQTLESEINSMLQILESRDTALRVVDEIGVDTIIANNITGAGQPKSKPPSMTSKVKQWLAGIKEFVLPKPFKESREERALRLFQQQASFWAPKNSHVLEISYKAKHPQLAQQVTSCLTDAFIDEHLRISQTEGSLHFFTHQSEELKQRLATAEENLEEGKSVAGLVSIEGQRLILEQQAASLRARELANKALLASAEAKVQELNSILETLPPRVEADQTTAQSGDGWYRLREKLFELQIREHELASKYSEQRPEVIAVKQQREAIEKILASQSQSATESVSAPNPTYQLMQQSLLNERAQVVALTAEKESLEKQRQAYLVESARLNENVVEISELEREKDILEESYLASMARMEQARILSGLKRDSISSVNKLQSATFSSTPAGWGRLKTLLFGILLGIFCGIGWAALAEYFDRSFVTATQVENALDLPVLVSIPRGRHQQYEVSRNG